MKKFFCVLIFLSLLLIVISCSDNVNNPDSNDSGYKVKMNVFQADLTKDSTLFRKVMEVNFDGDTENYNRRNYFLFSTDRKGRLYNGFSNVPLAYYKYGSLLKEVDYTRDSAIFAISSYEYDNEGYIYKATFEHYSTNNTSAYINFQRNGNKLLNLFRYDDSILTKITYYTYNKFGLIELQIDSSLKSKSSSRTIYKYNGKNELIDKYNFSGSDITNGNGTQYFYDDNGYNIKQISYTINSNDTVNTQVTNYIVYKGYLMQPEEISKFIFDSNDNIIGYTNDIFHFKAKN